MKIKQILHLFLYWIGASLFVGCIDDTFTDNSTRVEEGLPAYIQLNFQSEQGTVVTRAERDPAYENRVENLYIFIFDEGGNVHERGFYTADAGISYGTDGQGNVVYNKGSVQISTKSLNKARIVGIANLTIEGSTSTAYQVTEKDMDNINSYMELQQAVMKLRNQSIERYALFMMTGYAMDDDENTTVLIPGNEGTVPETLECTLQLERTDAKVKFEVVTEPANASWTEFSFLPKTWTVKQVPAQSYLLKADVGDYSGTEASYFDTKETAFEKIERDDTGRIYTGGSFVFYMPENKKEPQNDVNSYAQRDVWTADGSGGRNFTNANAYSTYVELTGTLSYRDNQNNVNADVRFIIHLGNASDTNPNDYDTERNYFYTYHVKVRGVNNIEVEVENGTEVRPGYEGDVVTSQAGTFDFDSHYDRCLITINPASLGDKIYWSVNTPFSRGIYQLTDGNEEVPKDMRDYRWIKFAINEDYGVDEGEYVKYPGDQNYDDPYPLEGYKEGEDYNASSPYYTTDGRNYPEARLRDINQLMRHLKGLKDKGINKNMTVTVFVDENLYFKNPITGEEDGEHRSLWKLTTDKEDRVMHLIVDEAKFSPDNNSSVIEAQYTFKQRSIQTIFNVDKAELATAWGLESKMETLRLPTGDVSQGSSLSNGRENCLKWLLNKKWTEVINTAAELTAETVLNDGYKNAAYACLLRNRDLNGNNIVEANEVRWYLAAIDQLTSIYIGEYALDDQSRLYPSNKADREGQIRWHYTSSSAKAGDGAWIIWAEEGASRGGSPGSKDDDNNTNEKFSYRCIRNLGLRLDEPGAEPTKLFTYEKDATDGNYVIDATNLNVKARRTLAEEGRLPSHDERSDVNRPYAKFKVANQHSVTRNGVGTWAEYQTATGIYPSGFRMPNQRELLIMSTTLPSDAWQSYSGVYICQTAFSMDGDSPYDKFRDGFIWDSLSGNFLLLNGGERGAVRSVKDIVE